MTVAGVYVSGGDRPVVFITPLRHHGRRIAGLASSLGFGLTCFGADKRISVAAALPLHFVCSLAAQLGR
jgi:hypothetical protein